MLEYRMNTYWRKKFFDIDLLYVNNFIKTMKHRISRNTLGEQFFNMS